MAADAGRPETTGTAALLRSRKFVAGACVTGMFVLLAALGPVLAPYDPSETGPVLLGGPSWAHLLGTTGTGQDVLSQLLVGTRLSLLVGAVAAGIGEAIAVVVGIASGFVEGLGGELLSSVTNVWLVLPVLPLEIVLASYFSNMGWFGIALIIGVTAWPWQARLLRGQTLSIRQRDYIASARLSGDRGTRLVLMEVFPNVLAIVVTGLVFNVIFGVVIQTGLAFIGIGNLSAWSWGTILYWSEEGAGFMAGAWWWFVPPGLCLGLLGMGLGFMNIGIDEVINPRLRTGGRVKARTETTAQSERRVTRAEEKGVGGAETKLAPVGGEWSGAMVPPATLLEVRGLSVEYGFGSGAVHAVIDVDLAVSRGEVLGVVGESGSGKSTLALAIMGLLRPPGHVVRGCATFYGTPGSAMDVLGASAAERRAWRWAETSMVFQASMNALNPVKNVYGQFADAFRAHKSEMDAHSQRERICDMLDLVGVPRDRLRAYPHELSGGMRQRVMIAMALLLSPKLVIMDEPTTALDVVIQREIVTCLKQLRRELGFSVIFISHDISLILEVADRVAVMYAGRVVEVAAAERLGGTASHPYCSALLRSFPSIAGPRRKLAGIPGSLPDMRNIPVGCAFAARCAEALEICSNERPVLRGWEGIEVACFARGRVGGGEGTAVGAPGSQTDGNWEGPGR